LVDSQRLSSIKIPTRRPRLQFKPTSQKMLRVATVARRLAEAEMVKCEGCNTWQHLSCYYVNGLTPSDHVCEAAAAAAGHDAGPSHSAEREKKELLLEQYRLKSALQATEANLKETREKLSKRGMAFNKHAEDFNTLTAFVEGGKTFCMGCGKPLAKVAVKCARDGRVMIECRDSFCYFKNTI
jgi:hypothetical protein